MLVEKKAERHRHSIDTPHFAPQYRYGDHISYSPLNLILEKGYIKVNPKAVEFWSEPDRDFAPPGYFVDVEIERLGQPHSFTKEIQSEETVVEALSAAMTEDMQLAEKTFPEHTNVVMCGGKDSLNLLLLPWTNPVLVVSADPNYPLVREFLKENGLSFDIIKLEDERNVNLEKEILINCCRNNLSHCKWGGHLKEISTDYNKKVIFWKGQVGAALLNYSSWRVYKYTSPQAGVSLFSHLSLQPDGWIEFLQRVRNKFLDPQQVLFEAHWKRGAHWQGAHMGFLHELTGAPVLSGYHGPNVTEIIKRIDHVNAVTKDIRPLIGDNLFGGKVAYPETNPGPKTSSIREGVSDVSTFLKTLKKHHAIEIIQ